VVVCLLALLVAAPAAVGGSTPHPRQLGPFGRGADRYWLWRAPGKPKAVVLFLHGLDRSELSPANHLPWIEHLVGRGADVVYPAYEAQPGDRGALRHTLNAFGAALRRLGPPKAPVVFVGYSRGGRLAVEFGAVAELIQAAPAAVLSIFPSGLNPLQEEVIDLRTLEPFTKITIAVAEEDSREGARELLVRLRDAGVPARNVKALLVRSHGAFHADHFSALRTGPEVRRQLWAPLDRMIASAKD
jgi:pimeloyl-ACP methyl ester carboxylesterase